MATRSSRTSSLSQLTADRSALLSRRTFAAAGGAAAGMAAAAALTRQAHAGFLSDFYANVLGASGATGEADAADGAASSVGAADATGVSRRPMLLQQLAGADASEDADQVPSCVDNPWAADLSNVANVADTYLTDAQASALAQRGFFQALMAGGSEFFQLYESNRYNLFPSFVTVDAMVHTYHLYFAYLLRTCERDRLSAQLCELSRRMLVASVGQLQALAGTEWEAAATLCAGFFAVGTALLDAGASELAQVPAQVQQAVDAELALIYAADGVEPSPLFDQSGLAVASAGDASLGEDYSQYAPRGYYAGDAQLEAYFRAMMWYGRRSFTQSNEVLDRCALLATLALAQADDTGEAPAEEWGAVYQVTAFFAGASDDNGYYEYLPLAQQAYGADVSVTSLPGDNAAWRAFHQLTAEAPSPQINSVPMRDEGEGADHVSANQGFRFMGQRFTVDEAVFQKLVYSEVGARDDGACRMLPDVLDLPAALGSAPAYAILDAQGDTGYAGYAENLGKLQTALEEAPADLWRASLAAQWLNMLRPLLDEKGAGWPNALRGDAWARRNLQTFAGSYTELKHDTVLYAKQVMAEAGGGPLEERDDRGYVEPEPAVFGRLSSLVQATSEGMARFGMLGEADAENLAILQELADRLRAIANKELRDELPTDEEFDLIRGFGAQIEHFWQAVHEQDAGGEPFTTTEFPAAVVTDIATDPNGSVLEVGRGGGAVRHRAGGRRAEVGVGCVVQLLPVCAAHRPALDGHCVAPDAWHPAARGRDLSRLRDHAGQQRQRGALGGGLHQELVG